MNLDAHPLVGAARAVAADLLAPQAAQVDQGTVPRSHLDALGAAGLLGVAAPPALGGTAAPQAVVRRVSEVLAGADLATWFVQAQHHGPVRALVAAGRFDQRVRLLATGRLLSGIAFSQLRRWPERPVAVTRHGAGWRFDGVAPWFTGWGINDVLVLSGVDDDGTVVHALVDAREQPGLRAGEALRVAALQSAQTVALRLDGLVVTADDVVSTERIQTWAAADDRVTVNVNPAVFGVTASAVELLAAQGERRGESEAVKAAFRIEQTLAEVRDEAYRLLDDVPADEATDRRLRVRAQAQRLMIEATTALVVSGAGGSMAITAPAQRKAREALFLLVQAQTKAARTAALQEWGRP